MVSPQLVLLAPEYLFTLTSGLNRSDHYGVFCNIFTSYDVKSVNRLFYQYNKADLTTLCETLYRVPWGTCFSPESDINEVWNKFKDLLFATVSHIAPVAKQKGKKRHAWISVEIISHSRNKHRVIRAVNVTLQTLIYAPNIKHYVTR